jgi:hypothetical protein
MKTLFAGPFVGEFGFELFEWQGYIRNISKEFDRTIICSRPGHRLLYKDFCDEFIEFEPGCYDCAGWTNYGYKYHGGIHEKYNPNKIVYIDNESDAYELKNHQQDFVSFNDSVSDFEKTDIIIHPRKITMNDDYKKSRNWSKDNWIILVDKLLENGLSVGCIGLKKCAEYIEKTKDLMDVDLETLSKVLSNAKMVVGSSSGPMHFASLCQCPQLVWTSNLPGIGFGNKENYEFKWNIFNTKVKVYEEEGWNPNPYKINELIWELM